VTRRPQILLAQYGDGYEQRVADGFQARRLEATVLWNGLSVADGQTIDGFFNARGGAEPFLYQLPADTITRRWVCSEWTKVEESDLITRISATWREVFDI